MRFYLSSYKIGDDALRLKELAPAGNKKTAYIANALDFSNDATRRKEGEDKDIVELKKFGLDAELLDLRDYFGKQEELEKKIEGYGAFWVRGGNVFVLRLAMKLSGFDLILKKLSKADILYGGFSAGVCVLGPILKGLELVDDPNVKPYLGHDETVWDGLGLINYLIVPHYKSDHPESERMDKVIEYLAANKISFKTLKDGEVLIIN